MDHFPLRLALLILPFFKVDVGLRFAAADAALLGLKALMADLIGVIPFRFFGVANGDSV